MIQQTIMGHGCCLPAVIHRQDVVQFVAKLRWDSCENWVLEAAGSFQRKVRAAWT